MSKISKKDIAVSDLDGNSYENVIILQVNNKVRKTLSINTIITKNRLYSCFVISTQHRKIYISNNLKLAVRIYNLI